MDSLFHFFFGYRPVIFQQGEFRLAPSTGSYVAAAIAVAAIVATVLTYRAVAARGRVRDRIVLTVLRLATLALVLFCLFRPILVVKAAVPQQNFLAVLIDDSRSMQITDWGTEPRGAFVKQTFGKDAALVKAAVGTIRSSDVPVLLSGGAPPVDRRADVRRGADPPRRGSRRRAPGARGVAAGRDGPCERRRGHDRRVADRRAARVEGSGSAGVHRRRRPGPARARRAGRPRLDAADRAARDVAA